MDEIWSGDRAVLTAVVELYETTGEHIKPRQVVDAFPEEEHDAVLHSLRRLGDHGFIETVTASGMGQNGAREVIAIRGVTEKGLQTSGAWPNNAELLTDRILEALADRARNEPDPKTRSKLQTIGGVSRDVLVDIVGTAIGKSLPGS